MGKLSTTLYSDTGPGMVSGTSNLANVRPSLIIPAASLLCTRINSLSEGVLKQVVVKQTAGTLVPFTVEVLCSKVPFPVGPSVWNALPAGIIEMYRVIPQQIAPAGGVVMMSDDNSVGWPFLNLDGNYTMNQRYIYLVIIPNNAPDQGKWDAFLQMESTN